MKPRKIHSKKVPQNEPRNKFNKKQTKYQAKMNTQLMAEKKTKNYATKKTYLQLMAEKSNNSTMTKENFTYYLWRKQNYSKKTELWLTTYSSAKNECYNVYLGIHKNTTGLSYISSSHATELEKCWINWSWLYPTMAVMFFLVSPSGIVCMIF